MLSDNLNTKGEMHSIISYYNWKRKKSKKKIGSSTYLSLFSFFLSFSEKFIFSQFLVGSPHGHVGSPSKLSIKKSVHFEYEISNSLNYFQNLGLWNNMHRKMIKNGWLSVYVWIENKSAPKKLGLYSAETGWNSV